MDTNNKTENIENTNNSTDAKTSHHKKSYIRLLATVFILFLLFIILVKFNLVKFLNFGSKKLSNKNVIVASDIVKKDTSTSSGDTLGYGYYDEKLSVVFQDIDNINKTANIYNNKIVSLEEKNKILEEKIEILQNKIQDLSINPQKIQLISIALNVKNKINLGESYGEDIAMLKKLSLNNGFLLSKVEILEKNTNMILSEKTINDDFISELNNFIGNNNILKNADNRFLKFFANFVTVRKVKNLEYGSADYFAVNMEKFMLTKNYKDALRLIEDNSEYEKYFKQTIFDLRGIVLLNSTSVDIVNYLING